MYGSLDPEGSAKGFVGTAAPREKAKRNCYDKASQAGMHHGVGSGVAAPKDK